MKVRMLNFKTWRDLLIVVFLVPAGIVAVAAADEPSPIVIKLENHHFEPSEVHIPADKKVVILVKNLDATPDEFESAALHVSKVLPPKSETRVSIPATAHGHYTFVGEHHEKTARGVVIAD